MKIGGDPLLDAETQRRRDATAQRRNGAETQRRRDATAQRRNGAEKTQRNACHLSSAPLCPSLDCAPTARDYPNTYNSSVSNRVT